MILTASWVDFRSFPNELKGMYMNGMGWDVLVCERIANRWFKFKLQDQIKIKLSMMNAFIMVLSCPQSCPHLPCLVSCLSYSVECQLSCSNERRESIHGCCLNNTPCCRKLHSHSSPTRPPQQPRTLPPPDTVVSITEDANSASYVSFALTRAVPCKDQDAYKCDHWHAFQSFYF